ncbi:50S ribosomal protein L4 [Naumannella halotolerans]|uniref:50S ribosomal protein L4 n=1 Tax=Naumannella halotolerans TaxID=993414 RepID=UPI00370DD6A2
MSTKIDVAESFGNLTDKTVDVVDLSGGKVGTATLPGSIFDTQTNIPLIHQVVVAQLAAARQGTHDTKTRGEVRGGGAKPWRQKGTGRARQGSRRAPQWTGGGVVHGPTPRNYAQRTPKKMVAAALRGVLSDRARDNLVFVVSGLSSDAPRTKEALGLVRTVAPQGKVLVALAREEENAYLSLRNVTDVHVIAVDQLNAYDVLVGDSLILTEAALAQLVAGPATGKGAKAVARESETTVATETAAVAEEDAK